MSDDDELSLECEQLLIDILNDTLQQYLYNHIIYIITSYLFCNEYYFRRDCHLIDIIDHTITLYLYKSKLCKNLFKLKCRIKGIDFLSYIDSICSVESTPNHYDPSPIINKNKSNPMSAWIDTECKDDEFYNSKSANMMNNSYFLLMTYYEESRQNITPWLVQWKYNNNNSMPYIQVITRIISYPSDWNYVTITSKHKLHNKQYIASIFYTSMEQHTIQFIPQKNNNHTPDSHQYKEKVKIIKFGFGLDFPWLMFGSAATKILNYNDIMLIFGNNESSKLLNPMNTMDKKCEYFVTRSCKDFVEMRDHGSFWTTSRDHISILQITEKRNYYKKKLYDIEEKKEENTVDFNVLSQFPIFNNVNDEKCNFNILDVTVTNDWSLRFQNKYNVKYNNKSFMVLYTEIRHDIKTTELYASYINCCDGIITLKQCKLAASKCLTKFLVGRGSYQTIRNDWMCTLIGVDENNHEVRHQLRLTEELELLYYHRVKRNENVQEVTNRYKCKALKYFKRAKKEEHEMQQRANQQPTTAQMIWHNIVASRHLILSTLIGAYIGWRVSRAFKNGQWTFSKFRFGF